jgi:flavin reductase (DIM6/NTAB) family NADH-FMN oxidoreductase RutF
VAFSELQPDQASFRRALGLFATGVGLITAQAGSRVHGMTANAISSVSLDPLLVLVCVGKQARLAELVEESGSYAINFLTHEQEPVARHFASRAGDLPPEFHFDPWECAPRLRGCLAALGCRLVQRVDAGDHWILIGRVVAVAVGAEDVPPLLFYRGAYRRLAPVGKHPHPGPPDLLTTSGASLYYDEWDDEHHRTHERWEP